MTFNFPVINVGLTQSDGENTSSQSSARPSHGVKRKYNKSNNGDHIKTSVPKKEPKLEPEIMLQDPVSEHGGEALALNEGYDDYGDYEAGPSGEGDDSKGRLISFIFSKQHIAIFWKFEYLILKIV